MAYRQPRVPQMQGEDVAEYLREIARFLREDCMAGWNADRQKEEELARIKRRLDALEARLTVTQQEEQREKQKEE